MGKKSVESYNLDLYGAGLLRYIPKGIEPVSYTHLSLHQRKRAVSDKLKISIQGNPPTELNNHGRIAHLYRDIVRIFDKNT